MVVEVLAVVVDIFVMVVEVLDIFVVVVVIVEVFVCGCCVTVEVVFVCGCVTCLLLLLGPFSVEFCRRIT